MSFLFFSILIGVLALPLVTQPLATSGRITPSGFTGTGVLIGFGVTILVSVVTSPLFGIGFVLAVLLHEVGSAFACRIIGHDVARIRLVPLPRLAPPRTDQRFDHALEESFAALYAPALAIAPMVLALGLFQAMSPFAPSVANFLRTVAIMLGTFNFLILLPFMPFAGGRIVRAISDVFWPNFGTTLTLFMSAAFASAAVRDQSIAMAILAAAGLQSLFYRKRTDQTALSQNEALLVMACYAFVLAVHFLGGFWLLKGLI